MVDMLVKLYELPPGEPLRASLAEQGITVRRCQPYEAHVLEHWVATHFSPKWVSECRIAMAHQPIGCVIATRGGSIQGFACYDVTARGFIGPMGVSETARGGGIGRALLITAAEQLKALGYAYAIIGGAGPTGFYECCLGALPIPGSSPGIYADLLPDPPVSATYSTSAPTPSASCH